MVLNVTTWEKFLYIPRNFYHRYLAIVPNIQRSDKILILLPEKPLKSINNIGNIPPASALATVPVDCEWPPRKSLRNEVRYCTSVIRPRARAKHVEKTRNTNSGTIHSMKFKQERFGATFAFVVCSARSGTIDSTSVGFWLRSDHRISIHF
jgi:hypothetical protein